MPIAVSHLKKIYIQFTLINNYKYYRYTYKLRKVTTGFPNFGLLSSLKKFIDASEGRNQKRRNGQTIEIQNFSFKLYRIEPIEHDLEKKRVQEANNLNIEHDVYCRRSVVFVNSWSSLFSCG